MASLAELQGWQAALKAARYSGNKVVEYDNKRVEYKTDAEMRQALADLEAEINAASGTTRITDIRIYSSKGF